VRKARPPELIESPEFFAGGRGRGAKNSGLQVKSRRARLDTLFSVFGDCANIRWRYHFGPELSQSVRGVTLMRLRDGLIVEALAYAKSGDASAGAAAVRIGLPAHRAVFPA
jgi:hypothetical protein